MLRFYLGGQMKLSLEYELIHAITGVGRRRAKA